MGAKTDVGPGGETVKVNKKILSSIDNLFKYELFAAHYGQFVFKQVEIILPPTTLTAGNLARGSIQIDQDSHFLCKEAFVIYTKTPDETAVNRIFTEIKIYNPADENEIMRDYVDVRALGSPWSHNIGGQEFNDKYYFYRPIPFPHIFKNSTRINIRCRYYHPSEIDEKVIVIFRGNILDVKYLNQGDFL
jgi:hypothetical protein